ncbi:MAG: Ubiquitin carboxyl-terminal hydrolase 21 [Cirrosporium novae-zelandiae]|nr:MAG: Ubiquitin carboxyl-terminal hydrolase 21 [Cirrosporium novae-zelandiae]
MLKHIYQSSIRVYPTPAKEKREGSQDLQTCHHCKNVYPPEVDLSDLFSIQLFPDPLRTDKAPRGSLGEYIDIRNLMYSEFTNGFLPNVPCPSCSKTAGPIQVYNQKTCFLKAPEVLFIQIKYPTDSFQGRKDYTIQYPDTLDLTRFTEKSADKTATYRSLGVVKHGRTGRKALSHIVRLRAPKSKGFIHFNKSNIEGTYDQGDTGMTDFIPCLILYRKMRNREKEYLLDIFTQPSSTEVMPSDSLRVMKSSPIPGALQSSCIPEMEAVQTEKTKGPIPASTPADHLLPPTKSMRDRQSSTNTPTTLGQPIQTTKWSSFTRRNKPKPFPPTVTKSEIRRKAFKKTIGRLKNRAEDANVLSEAIISSARKNYEAKEAEKKRQMRAREAMQAEREAEAASVGRAKRAGAAKAEMTRGQELEPPVSGTTPLRPQSPNLSATDESQKISASATVLLPKDQIYRNEVASQEIGRTGHKTRRTGYMLSEFYPPSIDASAQAKQKTQFVTKNVAGECILCALRLISYHYWADIEETEILKTVRNFWAAAANDSKVDLGSDIIAPKWFPLSSRDPGHQDAGDFFRWLMGRIDATMGDMHHLIQIDDYCSNIMSHIRELFVKSYFTCLSCNQGRLSDTPSPWAPVVLSPQLNKEDPVHLSTLIAGFFGVYTTDSNNLIECPECKKKTETMVHKYVERYPSILSFQIQDEILDQTNEPLTTEFRNKKVILQDEISITPYQLEEYRKNDVRYQLAVVIQHTGTIRAGHYIAQVRSRNNDGWYEMNDSHIRPIKNPVDEVLHQNNTGGFEAYMVFYQNIQEIEDEEMSEKNNKKRLALEESSDQPQSKQLKIDEELDPK